jgi:hypothetical protein
MAQHAKKLDETGAPRHSTPEFEAASKVGMLVPVGVEGMALRGSGPAVVLHHFPHACEQCGSCYATPEALSEHKCDPRLVEVRAEGLAGRSPRETYRTTPTGVGFEEG